MRSHMPTLQNFCIEEEEDEVRPSQLSDDTSDVSSSSSEAVEIKRNGLREKHQKFAFTCSDESQTEPSRNIINLPRKRSKRTRKLDSLVRKKMKTSQLGYKTDPKPPHSSDSDTTTDEDLAFCLMMLSRDKWKKNETSDHKEVVEEMETEDSRKTNPATTKGRYTCETCGKVFTSYQALGGHRASHKKNRVSSKTEQRSETEYENVVVVVAEKRIHECPICLRVFTSGQALGGHKRSHGLGNMSVNHHHQAHGTESVKQRMIDLNFPPVPTEENEVSVVFQ